MTAPSTQPLVTNGAGGEPMPTVLSPADFERGIRNIIATKTGHDAHRALDLFVEKHLFSLGYGEGMKLFHRAVYNWHNAALTYPFKSKSRWRCLFGIHDWRSNPEDDWNVSEICHHCGKKRSWNPCP